MAEENIKTKGEDYIQLNTMEEKMENKRDLKNVTLLGNQNTKYEFNGPNADKLETFENEHPDVDYVISFKAPEFTSLCPKTAQPDFATIYINYIADKRCVESKSLKLYLFSYRNFGEFHEDCVNRIMKDIIKTIKPRWIRVEGQFRPRGGISIVPVAEYCDPEFDAPNYVNRFIEHEFSVS